MKAIWFTLLFWLFFDGSSLGQDYRIYHKNIIEAEAKIFVRHQFNEGLDVYVNTFSQYDFVFLTDCITAMYVALYIKDTNRFLIIAKKATQNGLLPRQLLHLDYINNNSIYKEYKDSIISLYEQNRHHYLKRLDTTTLKKIYQLCAFDQMAKEPLRGERTVMYKRRYKESIKKTMEILKQIIKEKGFPADKLIGTIQNDVMKELRLNAPDFIGYYYKYKDLYNIRKDQFTLNEDCFSATLHYPMIYHYFFEHSTYSIYSDSFFLKQIALGNIHPKDFAAINDIRYNVEYNLLSVGINPHIPEGKMYFGLGKLIGPAFDNKPLRRSDEEIDRFRKIFFIAPIENDREKWRFMKKNGMYIDWGYGGLRS